MDYERIRKAPQVGIISPTKLRMKLMGPHHQKKKDGSSNTNSTRTSPSKLQDSEFLNNSLLASHEDSGNSHNDEDSCSALSSLKSLPGVENYDTSSSKTNHQFSRAAADTFCASNSIHPVRILDDENLDYDSNASSSSFEFHKGDRSLHNSITRSISRQIPSKWNNAEKWIMNRNSNANCSTKSLQGHVGGRFPATNTIKVVPDSGSASIETNPNFSSQLGIEKFSFVSPAIRPALGHICTQTTDLGEIYNTPFAEDVSENSTDPGAIRTVAMRDMGTEMTPVPSQEPSRTATPIGATTPLRSSPTSSLPSTPRVRAPASTPTYKNGETELSEREIKNKTRTEIVALGVRLGKMNIAAAWASKEEQEQHDSVKLDELVQIENQKRADAWKEAENAKHLARYKREELMIQTWECQEKEKLKAEIRRLETHIEEFRGEAQAKMSIEMAKIRRKAQEKKAAKERRRNREANKTAAQAEYIRKTGRIPSSNLICCGWF